MRVQRYTYIPHNMTTTKQINHMLRSSSVASEISVCSMEFKKSFDADCLFKYKLAISIGIHRKLNMPSTMKYVRAFNSRAGSSRHTPTIPEYPTFITTVPSISTAIKRAQMFGISSSVNSNTMQTICCFVNFIICQKNVVLIAT